MNDNDAFLEEFAFKELQLSKFRMLSQSQRKQGFSLNTPYNNSRRILFKLHKESPNIFGLTTLVGRKNIGKGYTSIL